MLIIYWYFVRCSGDSFACPANYTCRDSGSNPNLGVTSFDNLAEGLITTFQISSTKGCVRPSHTTAMRDSASRAAREGGRVMGHRCGAVCGVHRWINVTFYLQDGYSKVRLLTPHTHRTTHHADVSSDYAPCLLAGLQFAWPFTLALLFLTNCVLLNLFPAILTTKFYGVLMAYVTAPPHLLSPIHTTPRSLLPHSPERDRPVYNTAHPHIPPPPVVCFLSRYNNMMEQKKKDQEALRKRLGGGAKEEVSEASHG